MDYLALLENSADPSHVHFTHAGFIGGRDRAGPIAVRLVEQARRGRPRGAGEGGLPAGVGPTMVSFWGSSLV